MRGMNERRKEGCLNMGSIKVVIGNAERHVPAMHGRSKLEGPSPLGTGRGAYLPFSPAGGCLNDMTFAKSENGFTVSVSPSHFSILQNYCTIHNFPSCHRLRSIR